MRKDYALQKAEVFFAENAGYGYNPATETAEEGRTRCAKLLALAEQWAHENGVSAVWDYEEDQTWDGDCPAPDGLFYCIVRHGDQIASLGAIGDPTANYRRVVEAELYSELMHAQQTALADYAGLLS